MSNIDIILRALGADAVADSFHSITTGAQDMGNSVENAGNQAGQGLDAAGQHAAALDKKFEGLRNAGGIITGIGVASLLLSANLRSVAEEGNAMEARLESILKVQERFGELDAQNDIISDITVRGHFDDDDGLRDAAVKMDSFAVKTEHMAGLLEGAARQARTMGTDVSGVAEQLAKAYNTGNVAALKKSGVTLDTSEIEKLNAAYARSAAEGQAMFATVIGAAITTNTVALEDSLTGAQAAANDVARGMDDLKTTIGTGAAEAHAAIDQGILLPLLNVLNAHPGLLKTAGGILEIGGSAFTVIGPLIAFAGQVGMMRIGLAGMGTAGAAAFKSMMASALAAAPAIWGAMAPLLPLLLAIAAAALLTTAVVWQLSGARKATEQAGKDNAQADAADREFYDKQVARRGAGKSSDVGAGETFEQWRKRNGRGEENSDAKAEEKASGAPPDLGSLQSQLDAMKSGGVPGGGMPSMPIPTPGVMPKSVLPSLDEDEEGEMAAPTLKATKTRQAKAVLGPDVSRETKAPATLIGSLAARGVAEFLAGGGTLFDAGKTGKGANSAPAGEKVRTSIQPRVFTAEEESRRTLPDRKIEIRFKPLIISDGNSNRLGDVI